ncbi:MAG: signal peptidase I [bacterium]
MGFVKKTIDFVIEILETIAFVGSIFIVIYLFIMQPNQVKGSSMYPSLNEGDYIFTSKITYKFRDMERGDIVVFRSPENPDIEFIKRIIGLAGDEIMISDNKVYLNNQIIQENYINQYTPTPNNAFLKEGVPIIVPQDHVFIMGDHREVSSDSRIFGPIPISSLIGQVFYRYYPLNKVGAFYLPSY